MQIKGRGLKDPARAGARRGGLGDSRAVGNVPKLSEQGIVGHGVSSGQKEPRGGYNIVRHQ